MTVTSLQNLENGKKCGTVLHIHSVLRLIAKGKMDNDLNVSLKLPTNSPLLALLDKRSIHRVRGWRTITVFCVSADKISHVEMSNTFMGVGVLSLCYIYRSNQLNIEQFTF